MYMKNIPIKTKPKVYSKYQIDKINIKEIKSFEGNIIVWHFKEEEQKASHMLGPIRPSNKTISLATIMRRSLSQSQV